MKLNIEPLIFNATLKETMDFLGLQGTELAEAAGRTRQNISEIRQGKTFPSVKDFASILTAAEQKTPGFCQEFAKRLIQRISHLPAIYQERADLDYLLEKMNSDELMQTIHLISSRLIERIEEKKSTENSKKNLVSMR